MKPKKDFAPHVLFGAAVLLLTVAQASFAADDRNESSADKQRKLIAILQSDAPPQDKAIPCKQLAIYGNKDAVPALAPLLADKDLASWARIALEAIPGPEADEALRGALPKLQGNLLIGAMNSIGVRRDAKAVNALAGKLSDADVEVFAAAAVALGKISGTEKRSYQVQGARGYLLYVQENKKLSNADKVSAIDNLLPLLKQPPEQRLAISALSGIPTGRALESLVALAGDPGIAEEACLTIVNVATAKNLERTSKEVRQNALQTALDKSKNDSTRKKAGEALKAIE